MRSQTVSPNCSQRKVTPTSFQIVSTVLVCALAGISLGCAMLGLSSSSTPSAQVAVSPQNVVLTPGMTQQFTATVQGTSNSAVTWSASSGTITSDGMFTAPSDAAYGTQISITAMSADVSHHGASALATIAPPPPLQIATSSLSAAVVNTGYSTTLLATGGTPPYTWSISAGTLPSGFGLQSSTGVIAGTTSQTGQYSLTVKVADSKSNSANETFTLPVVTSASGNFDGPAELPRVYLSTTMADTPAPGSVITVSANGNLQSALNSASCGDTIELQAGAIFSVGDITFPAKNCDDQHWIIVRTSASDSLLPAEGTRMTPCYAGVASLNGRPSFGCTSPTHALATISYTGVGDGPIIFVTGANHYRLLGLEVTRVANNGKAVGGLIVPDQSATMDKIVIDRMYIHGVPLEETRRGVRLAGATNTAVQDSYISDFHCNVGGSCTDSQAVSGGTGDYPMGPYKITNNFLEASGENILFGGGTATQTPTDIEVSRNYLYKPMIWMQGQPGFLISAIVKNHFELKNAQRVLVDSNVMENNWGGFSQFGFSIMLTPKNQDINNASVCPICLVTDVTVRNTTISHVGGGLTIANVITPIGGVPFDGQRFSIHDVIADDIDGTAYNGHGTFAEVSTVAQPLLQSVSINHVTAFPNHTLFNMGGPNTVQMPGFTFTNSIVATGTYPVWSTGAGGKSNCAYYDIPSKTMDLCFSGYVFSSNALLESPYSSSSWPTGNSLYTTSEIGFVNYNNGKNGDYHLTSSSPAVGKATDGTNLGANVDGVLSATSNVR
ncbi:MAG TPA: putative Ig domain-containing protein [Candidatus Sulfotelmatobacter sp.]|nr:putative Ig domain-containing protein [Candidatus Sulfotelmatobacter sp.]